MPNYCNYKMKITGKTKDIKEFINIIQVDYSYPNLVPDRHFFRVFEADVEKEELERLEQIPESNNYCFVTGYCAWSVSSCMTSEAFSYYSQHKNGLKTQDGGTVESKGTTLEIESERLNLVIEIYSEESGEGFEEHMLVIDGETIISESTSAEWYCIDDYESLEELNTENETEFTESDFDEDNYVKTGGFGEWVFDAKRKDYE